MCSVSRFVSAKLLVIRHSKCLFGIPNGDVGISVGFSKYLPTVTTTASINDPVQLFLHLLYRSILYVFTFLLIYTMTMGFISHILNVSGSLYSFSNLQAQRVDQIIINRTQAFVLS